jgi:FKBP-type peptidyl-prolyl cis-trans isomerase
MSVKRTVLRPGDGIRFPRPGDTVKVHFSGRLAASGKEFHTTYTPRPQRGGRTAVEPIEVQIGVGKVIRGWDEGVPQMSLGERAVLEIPAELAYGEKGKPGQNRDDIPPNSVVIFDMELMQINDERAHGVLKQTIVEGDGKTIPARGDLVHLHFIATVNGREVENTRTGPYTLFKFKVGLSREVMFGLHEGVSMMSLGERARLDIEPQFGYGSHGIPQLDIPGGARLTFEVDLLAVNNVQTCARMSAVFPQVHSKQWNWKMVIIATAAVLIFLVYSFW